MAGLLNIDPEELRRALAAFEPTAEDRAAAKRAGLMSAGLGMLSGTGNGLQNIGRGGIYGLNAYQQALADARSASQSKMGLLNHLSDMQYRDMQAKQIQEKIAVEKAAREAAQRDYKYSFGGGEAAPAPAIPESFTRPYVPPSNAIPQGNGVETYPVAGAFDQPTETPMRGDQMALMAQQAQQGDRLPPPQTPEQRLMAAAKAQKIAQLKLLAQTNPSEYLKVRSSIDAPMHVKEGEGYVLNDGTVVTPMPKGDSLSELGKLLREQGKYAEGNQSWKFYQQKIGILVEGEMPQDWRLFKNQRPDGTYKEFLDQQMEMKKAGASKTSVQVTTDSFGKAVGGEIGKDVSQAPAIARSAVQAASAIDEVQSLLDQGIITGFGAKGKALLGNAAQALNLKADDPRVARTYTAISQMSRLTLNSYSLLKGSGQVTEKEMELLKGAAGGDIDLPESTLRQVLAINRRAQRWLYDNAKTTASIARGLPELQGVSQFFTVPEFPEYAPPTPAAPGGGSPQLTPQERQELDQLRRRYRGG